MYFGDFYYKAFYKTDCSDLIFGQTDDYIVRVIIEERWEFGSQHSVLVAHRHLELAPGNLIPFLTYMGKHAHKIK